jgi:hypothetical protein
MPSSKSHSRTHSSHSRGAHGGGGDGSHDGGGGGGGGGGGPLVKVGFGRTQAEAEMLQGLLSEGGIPSVLKRSGGFDNPDFLSAGPHDVFVNSDNAHKARELLADTMLESEGEERAELEGERRRARGEVGGDASPARLALWVGVALIGAVILVWLLYQFS